MEFGRKPKEVSEIMVYFGDGSVEGKIFLGDQLTPEEVAIGFRKFADFLDSLGRWGRSEENDEGLLLDYADFDEGKLFASWDTKEEVKEV